MMHDIDIAQRLAITVGDAQAGKGQYEGITLPTILQWLTATATPLTLAEITMALKDEGATFRFDEHQFPEVSSDYMREYQSCLGRLQDLDKKHPDASQPWHNYALNDAPTFSEVSREMHRRQIAQRD